MTDDPQPRTPIGPDADPASDPATPSGEAAAGDPGPLTGPAPKPVFASGPGEPADGPTGESGDGPTGEPADGPTSEPADGPAGPPPQDGGLPPQDGGLPPYGSPPPHGSPPPYGVPAPAPRRLVRDPYSRLGGVASGIAHYYGLDVSLVRLVTLLLALTTGVGLLAYLLAWLIIPRAEYWPPAPPAGGGLRSVSNRDIGIGLAAVGILAALAIGGGAGGFLVPLVLVGGGVWLLLQPAAPPAAPAGTVAFAAAGPGAPPAGPPPAAGDWTGSAAYPPPSPVGNPVPPRSRRRRFAVLSLIATVAMVLLAIPLLLIGFWLFARSEVQFDTTALEIRPIEVAELSQAVDLDRGEVIIDLTDLDLRDFDDLTAPPELDVRVDAGRIEVIVPDGLEVSVEAEVGLGDIEVFDRSEDGIRPDVTITAADPDLNLTLDVGAGEIEVRRG